MGGRLCENWLKTLSSLVERTESPEHYWLWSGIFTLTSALERKVWVPYGLDEVYPNMYLILVSPPGKCRKGPPISLAKRLCEKVGLNVAADSGSKQMLCNEIASAFNRVVLPEVGTVQQSPMAVCSKEFSSLLAVDAKQMIEFLTDIYDPHDVWEYKVLSREPEKLYGPCLGLFAATTPTYLTANLPYEAFGAGFFSRVVFVVGENKRHRVAWPELSEENIATMKMLIHDLNIVKQLRGPFMRTERAELLFKEWYDALDEKYRTIKDEKFHGFIERAHIQVLKVAMALRVSYSDELLLDTNDVGRAIDLIEMVFTTVQKAFTGFGRSDRSLDVGDVVRQLQVIEGEISFAQLLSDNWHNMTPIILREVLDILNLRKKISVRHDVTGEEMIKWKGAKE